MSALLAVNWEWELRGTLIVIIAVGVLCGSLYLILGTNLGARLGFLVAFAGLAGWMFLMGAIWWSYGKGLLGPEASWKPVAGVDRHPRQRQPVRGRRPRPSRSRPRTTPPPTPSRCREQLQADGWTKLDPALPSFQQAGSSGSVFMEESGGARRPASSPSSACTRRAASGTPRSGTTASTSSRSGTSRTTRSSRSHRWCRSAAEPGRAPARAVVDTSRPHEYIYMIRDLGSKRTPAAIITISSLIIFLILCWLLHRRDRYVRANLAAKALPAKA